MKPTAKLIVFQDALQDVLQNVLQNVLQEMCRQENSGSAGATAVLNNTCDHFIGHLSWKRS
jgi:hypothetical protein